ncbi:DUF2934 domain-containing protein [Methylovulum miyakonense]|uniref:DUF2934 domain-containing protein n=1 Tax=Methylovulum miyakonense TaxID=645578 RepID=UPI00037800C3|nr:DUF2934 domain-containing protein [Methylovulum miyakonense]
MIRNLATNINRHQWIAEAAYFKAEARNFEPGNELEDWQAAEMAYLEMLVGIYVTILAEDGPMTVVSLQQLAALIGIENPESLVSELALVQAIQKATQHRPCFRSEFKGVCEEKECKWVTECRKLISVWY